MLQRLLPRQLPCPAALQQEKRQVELQAHSAKIDDAEVRQLGARMQQLEAGNSELQSQLAKEVRSLILYCHPLIRLLCSPLPHGSPLKGRHGSPLKGRHKQDAQLLHGCVHLLGLWLYMLILLSTAEHQTPLP